MLIFIKLNFLLLYSLLFLLFSCNPSKQLIADKAVLNLSNWNYQKNTHTLNGEWGFAWKQLIQPENPLPLNITTYIKMPSYWTKLHFNKETLPSHGYASLYLKIILPKELKQVAFSIPEAYSAVKIFINGNLLSESGKVSHQADKHKPSFKRSLFVYSPDSPELNLVFHISNYSHIYAGFRLPIHIGTFENINQREVRLFSFSYFLLGALIIMIIYYFRLYLLRKKEASFLYFVFFCISSGMLSFILMEPRIAFTILSDAYWPFLMKLFFLLQPLCAISGLLFAYSIFPDCYHRGILKIFYIFNTINLTFFLLSPLNYLMDFFLLIYIIIFSSLGYAIFGFFQAVYKKREGAFLFFIGLLIFFVTIVHDLLFTKNLIYSEFSLPGVGLLIIVFFQSVLLSNRFSKALKNEEQLALELLDYQRKLEEKVSMRTKDLEEANLLKDKFLSIVSHDLRSPLVSLQNTLQVLNGANPQKKEKLLDLAQKTLSSSLNMIKQLLDLSRLRTGSVKLYYTDVKLQNLVTRLIQENYTLLRKKNLTTHSTISEDTILSVDEQLFYEVLHNGFINAIKFSFQNQIIYFEYQEIQAYHCIIIEDSGMGISPEIIQKLFNSSEPVSLPGTDGEKGNGLGLSLCKDILKSHHGDLELQSEEMKGSKLIIKLPSNEEIFYIVSNNRNFRCELISEIMNLQPYVCIGMNNACEVLENLERIHPTVLIIDSDLPEMNGIKLIQKILENPDLQDLQFFLLEYPNTLSNPSTGSKLYHSLSKENEPKDLAGEIFQVYFKSEKEAHNHQDNSEKM